MIVEIHRGYARVLAGLKADIVQGGSNSSGNALFRRTYAEQILDQLAVEVKNFMGPRRLRLGPSWRSGVLNPLLQRQLHGYPDHEAPMLAKLFQGKRGQSLTTAVDTFYLSKDPLAADMQPELRRGILYVTEYRWFLGTTKSMRSDPEHFQECQDDTKLLYEQLACSSQSSESESELLQEFEVPLIAGELLEGFYREDIIAAVSLVKDAS